MRHFLLFNVWSFALFFSFLDYVLFIRIRILAVRFVASILILSLLKLLHLLVLQVMSINVRGTLVLPGICTFAQRDLFQDPMCVLCEALAHHEAAKCMKTRQDANCKLHLLKAPREPRLIFLKKLFNMFDTENPRSECQNLIDLCKFSKVSDFLKAIGQPL